eukprot:12407-Heterococcus_DN1.PRE.2
MGGRKRSRQATGWDDLAWKTVDVQLEQDDGWSGGGGADGGEGSLFGALEEIDGSAYAIEKDDQGVIKVIVHKRREEQPAVVAEAASVAPAAKAAKKKKKKKDAKPSAEAAAAAAAVVAESSAEQQDGDSMQVVEPAADDDDAAEEQELTAEAAATAAAGDEQYDDSADDTTAPAAADADSAAQHAAKGTGKNHKKNQRKKRNKLLKEAAADAAAAAPAAAASAALQRTAQWSLTDEQAASMAQWTYLGVPLHPALLFNLHKLGFTQPTAIQRATLPKAILGRRDIVGAAETGSGKTLAYGLPILSAILHSMDDTVAAAAAVTAAGDSSDSTAAPAAQKHPHQLPLQALVLCPTRELALQVTLHLTAVSEGTGVSIVSVVGGLAEVKQRRLLKRRPAVVVATPGRLWEMRMSEQHLRDLSGLRYLVIDEADRMTENGRFDELGKLMRVMTPDSDTAAAAAAAAASALKAVKGGKRGVKKQPAKGSKKAGKHSSAAKAAAVDESWMQTEQWLIDDSIDATTSKEGDSSSDKDDADDDGDLVTATSPPAQQSVVKAAVARQIFIYSATLSMQSEKKQLGKKGSSKSKGSNSSKDAPEASLERIMEVVGIVNKPSVVDLSQGTATTAVAAVEDDDGDAPQDEEQPPPALPESLTLAHVKSLQMEKDAWLYLFCTQYSGRTLVFVNAIVMARRLAEVLKLLRIPCAALHAQMQQRQRLRSLDFLRAEPTAVLIATDVAARGLDVPSVDHVVHYDMPRSAADFVHRSGRTARAGKSGFALAIVAPRDEGAYTSICKAIGKPAGLSTFPADARLLDKARERAAMAAKVARCEAARGKAGAAKSLLQSYAADAGMDVDDQALALADAEAGGGRGGAEATRLAEQALAELEACLAQPLHTDRRKFLPVAAKLTELAREAAKTAAQQVAVSGGKRRRVENSV